MRRPPLVVGMPVYRRAWVLNDWFDSLEAQGVPDGTHLLFALSPSDDGTEQIIAKRAPRAEVLYTDDLPTFEDDQKDAPGRYAVLAHIRNVLLRRVAALSPDSYLSWDSDIILRPDAFLELRAVLDGPAPAGARVDAVGALVDMGGDVYPGYWSHMILVDGEPHRLPTDLIGLPIQRHVHGVESKPWTNRAFGTGVICGVKLMGPRAYRNARYADHPWGEDVGWALQCAAMDVGLWVAPRARGEHRYRLSGAPSAEPTTSRSSSR